MTVASPLIGLLDCNNFFVSCERLFRPELLKRPVLVLSANDGCVVARSQEVKDIGIPMGVPYFQVKDIIEEHNIEVCSGNIVLYRDISRRVFEVLRRYCVVMEQYSIDEAFFTLAETDATQMYLAKIKDKIELCVGIPVSVALAASKTQAKYAATLVKNQGASGVLTPDQWTAMSTAIPLSHIWGVGRQLQRQYKAAGLLTVADVLSADSAQLQQLFGVVGRRLQLELQGVPALPVSAKRQLQKSLMSSRSFQKTVTDQAVLADAAAYHVRYIAAELRHMKAQARVMRVAMLPSRHGDWVFRGGSQEYVFDTPTNDDFTLLQAAQTLVEALFESDVPYKKLGVTLSGISAGGSGQPGLFADTTSPDRTALFATIDRLNQRAAKPLVLVGARLCTDQWQPQAAQQSAAYTTRWNELVTVSTTIKAEAVSDSCTIDRPADRSDI